MDDDHDDAELFAEALEVTNPAVDFLHLGDAHALFDYLNHTDNPKPDLLFLDLNMPEINGWQCLTKLKNDIRFQDIPVIIYSTSSIPLDRVLAHRSGALGLISKPADFNRLISILQRIVHAEITEIQAIIKAL